MGRLGFSREFTLLDGGVLVTGAAIAAAHFRLHAPDPHGLPAWLGTLAIFGWLAITASGPFALLVRRWRASIAGPPPGLGDWLWLVWGSPWVATALMTVGHPTATPDAAPGRLDPAYVGSLALGLIFATAVAVPTLIARLAWAHPRADDAPPIAWSQGVGLALTAAWPLQAGVGLVMMG